MAQKLRRPDDTRVRHMLSEVDARQKDFLKQRQEQERLYQTSQAAWIQRDISQALVTLERLAELARKTPEPRDRIVEYKNFYKVVRGEHDALVAALEQARSQVAAEDFGGALALCEQYLSKYPRHAGFADLKAGIEKRQREKQASLRAEVEARLAGEPSLDRQVQILEEGAVWYPHEPYYGEQLQRVRETQAQVASVVEAAQIAEDAGDLNQAVEQWVRLGSIYPRYPGLNEQIERLTQARLRKQEAGRLLAEAVSLASSGRHEEARGAFGRAYHGAYQGEASGRKLVLAAIVEQAQAAVNPNWNVAAEYLQTARSLDPAFSIPKDVSLRIEERKRIEFVDALLARTDALRKTGDLKTALREIEAGLTRYPDEKPLVEARASVATAQAEAERQRARDAALQQARELAGRANANLGNTEINRLLGEVKSLAHSYAADPEVYRSAVDAGQQLLDLQQARAKVAAGDLNAGRALCEKYLKDFPEHAGFLDVRAQITQREQQAAIEYMEEVNRHLQAEPDPALRLQVLEEVLRRYPEEPHYRDELELVREEQKLVRSIVEEANSLEKAGRFKDALDAWNRLRAIVRAYPDLDHQIARLTDLHEQTLQQDKARCREQIQAALDSFDHGRASELIRKAEAAFPGEFSEFARRAKQGADLRTRAQGLIADAQALGGKASWAECQTKLREAAETAPGDPLVLKQVVEADSKFARSAISSDWKAAETFLDHAAALDPSFKPRPELRAKIEEQKRASLAEEDHKRALEELKRLEESATLAADPAELQKRLDCAKTIAREFRKTGSSLPLAMQFAIRWRRFSAPGGSSPAVSSTNAKRSPPNCWRASAKVRRLRLFSGNFRMPANKPRPPTSMRFRAAWLKLKIWPSERGFCSKHRPNVRASRTTGRS